MLDRLFQVPVSDENLQRRGRTIITLALVLVLLIILAIPLVFFRPNPLPSVISLIIGVLIVCGSIFLVRGGHIATAGWCLIIFTTIGVILPSLIRREITSTLFYLVLPLLIAGVVLKPWHVWFALFGVFLAIAAQIVVTPADNVGLPDSIITLSNTGLIMFMAGMISFLSARVSASAFTASAQVRQEAEASAKQLALLNTSLETQVAEQTADLRSALADVESRMGEKQSLLDEIATQRDQIREMSMPVLPVDKHTLVLPLVGALDSQRLLQLQEQALTAIEMTHARTLLLDVTGVHVIDSQVAQGLIRTVQAVRLLGAEPVLIGVRPEVAQTLIALGIDLTGLRTASNLQSALHQNDR